MSINPGFGPSSSSSVNGQENAQTKIGQEVFPSDSRNDWNLQ